MRAKSVRYVGILLLFLGCAGCVTPTEHRATVDSFTRQVELLEGRLALAQESLQTLSDEGRAARDDNAEQIEALRRELDELPQALAAVCPTPTTTVTTTCDEDQPVKTVVMAGDKMVVGELERVWVDPPGKTIVARVDTGAHSSSLHAQGLIVFERDGKDWVRFELVLNGESTPLERKVERYVRVYQQADPEGSRRPVVQMRVRLGDVQDTFDFTLADRAHLDYEMLLGRNFLTDMALVDVGRQFVQPQYRPAD